MTTKNDPAPRFLFQTYIIVLKVTKLGEDQLNHFWDMSWGGDAFWPPSPNSVKLCTCHSYSMVPTLDLSTYHLERVRQQLANTVLLIAHWWWFLRDTNQQIAIAYWERILRDNNLYSLKSLPTIDKHSYCLHLVAIQSRSDATITMILNTCVNAWDGQS